MKIVAFVKNWTLPLAMAAGIIIYLAFAYISFLDPIKPFVHTVDHYLTPSLIFAQLLLTFCKVDIKEFRFRKWHIWLMAIQIIGSSAAYCAIAPFNPTVAQGAMVCLICPTATAAAVITSKLGGNAETLITYTMMINIVTAIFVPTVFPIIHAQPDVSFLSAFLLILSKVFPLLICPLIVAVLLHHVAPSAHAFLKQHASVAFYIWAVALTMVMGKTAKSIADDSGEAMQILWLALTSLAICCAQFAAGKHIGGKYNDRISGGQALGQKNTVLAIWMSYTYLDPITSVAPGAYVLWQNTINSWQLWKKRHTAQ